MQVENIARGASQSVFLEVVDAGEAEGLVAGGNYTVNGIQSVTSLLTWTGLELHLQFRNPFETAPGVYTDIVTVAVCHEWPCVNHIAGSPKVIAVTYTVVEPENPPAMVLQRNLVELDAFILDQQPPPPEYVDIVFANMGANNAPFVSVTGTGQTVTVPGNTLVAATPNPIARLTLAPESPAQFGVGTHTEVLSVRGCLDVLCNNEVEGSPATLTVKYNVTNTRTGENGFTVRPVPVKANHLVYDGPRGVFYLSIKPDAASHASSIAVLDPVTGDFTAHVPVGDAPGDLEISPDGQYLYVSLRGTGAVRRLRLPSLEHDLDIPLGTHPVSGLPLFAKELHVSPDAPGTIGVVRSTSPLAANEHDFAIFDDAAMRPDTFGAGLPAGKVTTFQWESGTRILGIDSASTDGSVHRLAVEADGLEVLSSHPAVAAFDGRATLIGDRVVMQRGRVFDAQSLLQLGFLPGSSAQVAVLSDASTGKAFMAKRQGIAAFGIDTMAPAGSISIPALTTVQQLSMARWGDDGLAVLTPENSAVDLLLIDGPFVGD